MLLEFPSVETAFAHEALYQFWLRSRGIWSSNLATVTVRFLTASEAIEIGKIHQLNDVEFGIELHWEYDHKPQTGHIRWCVDTKHANLIFPDRSTTKIFANRADTADQPSPFFYQFHNSNEIIMTIEDLEERVYLHNDDYRLREIRQNGQLIRRVSEHKLNS